MISLGKTDAIRNYSLKNDLESVKPKLQCHVSGIHKIRCQDALDRNLTAEIAELLKDLNNAPQLQRTLHNFCGQWRKVNLGYPMSRFLLDFDLTATQLLFSESAGEPDRPLATRTCNGNTSQGPKRTSFRATTLQVDTFRLTKSG